MEGEVALALTVLGIRKISKSECKNNKFYVRKVIRFPLSIGCKLQFVYLYKKYDFLSMSVVLPVNANISLLNLRLLNSYKFISISDKLLRNATMYMWPTF